eukprot:CAMPEP_0179911250 /NCGR_PEP_ID=MMETSP0982-20121206/46257_1 /TAXON_ID=483367 /ORGANISM="non described non described, Strain CCMP 2436" /LENGTH=206 /DNA_ID=CAMNT_0021812971 /DNA_START=90 /DNA_END=711 /DNA_ORIENTATION=-
MLVARPANRRQARCCVGDGRVGAGAAGKIAREIARAPAACAPSARRRFGLVRGDSGRGHGVGPGFEVALHWVVTAVFRDVGRLEAAVAVRMVVATRLAAHTYAVVFEATDLTAVWADDGKVGQRVLREARVAAAHSQTVVVVAFALLAGRVASLVQPSHHSAAKGTLAPGPSPPKARREHAVHHGQHTEKTLELPISADINEGDGA